MFIITGIMFSITVGAFMSIMIIGGFPERGEWKKSLTMFILSLAIGFGVATVFLEEEKSEEREWNNGFCPTCQKEWQFAGVSHVKNEGDMYYYVCEECGKIISRHP